MTALKYPISHVLCAVLLALAFFVICVCGSGTAVGSELYQYTDQNGTVVFTDDKARIPKSKSTRDKVIRHEQKASNAAELPFKLDARLMIVPVRLKYNGSEVNAEFVFDTGAALTVISPRVARQLGVSPEDTQLSLLQGVGGITIAGNVLLDLVQSGPVSWCNMEVGIVPLGEHDGLLGGDFLKGKRFQVDHQERVIRWQ